MKDRKNESVVDTLFDVGEAWASYGLKAAEGALQASARTLTDVSKLLGNLASELEGASDHEDHKDVIDSPST